MRQAIGHDAAPVLIDEFDRYRQRQQVMELFRTSSRGGKILRGTQNQSGTAFGVKHLAWFAAIESGTILGQDRNRFIGLELEPPKNRGVLDLPTVEDLTRLGRRLAAVALWAAPKALGLSDQIKRTQVKDTPGRLVESFSVPASMYAVVTQGRDVSTEDAKEILIRMLEGRDAIAQQGESNERQLLREILAAKIRVKETDDKGSTYCERTIGQLLDVKQGDRFPNQQELEAHGVKIVVHNIDTNERSLFLVESEVRKKLLKDSDWSRSRLDELLLRLPGAKRLQQRCGGMKVRGIALPWPGCLGEIEQ